MKKILRLEVSGFRSLKDIIWEPDDLNVVIGPNGTGKSNLLRILELISVSAQGRLSKYVQQSGGMEPLVWDGRTDKIGIVLKTTPPEPGRDPERESLTYKLELIRLGQTSSFRIDRELLGNFFQVDTGKRQEPFKFLERFGPHGRVFDVHDKALTAPEESFPEDETLLSVTAGPFTQNEHIPPFRSQLATWRVYHDLHVNQDAVIRQPSVAKPEKIVEPDAQNLIAVLHTLYTGDRNFKRDINDAMKAAFGDDFDEIIFPPAADSRIQLRVRWRSLKREQSAADLSDGTLRFLFLLTVLASPTPASLIAIDEPETGLHPSMLPLVAEYAVDASKRSQVILTTHSPDFLSAFHKDKPTTTVAEWNDGQTVLKKLGGEALGYWLKEYSLGELFRSGELETM